MDTGRRYSRYMVFFWTLDILYSRLARGDRGSENIPFKTVYLHGLVRTAKGEKMSKSKPETNIDPLDMINKYGADATRLSLIIGTGPGNDIKLSEDKIKEYKDEDSNIMKNLEMILENVTKNMEQYRFDLSADELYHYTWHTFADLIIEKSKSIFKDGDEIVKASRKKLLLLILKDILKALHPFMPYITEEIWKDIPKDNKDLLIIEKWPI